MANKKIILIPLILIVILMVLGGVYLFVNTTNRVEETPENNAVVSIPSSLENNCIGFLSYMAQETTNIPLIGAGWTRPHPGPFVWGFIEKKKGDYDFSKADEYVRATQENNIAILGTIWPFADWDQINNPECKVNKIDQFYPSAREEGIPAHRCKPKDKEAYKKFLAALVERYDGDGVDDMAGLEIPIKYWEVLNEPEMKSADLTFFVGDEEDYFEILKESYFVIKQACPDCNVLHAGNAGSQEKFLSFWDKVYSLGAGDYFDIANTHFIGGGDTATLNVGPLKNLLNKYNIDKPIWVTEVEYKDSKADVSSTVSGALSAGAQKIFFVSYKVGGLSRSVPGEYAEVYKEVVQLCPDSY